MITGPLKWYTIASALEQAAYADLTTKPDRHSVVPGAIAWDACDCGLLAVSGAQFFGTEAFPDQIGRPFGNCRPPYIVGEFVIQIIRCAPNPDDQTGSPTTADLDASAQEVLRDADEIYESVAVKLCEMKDARDISNFLVRPVTAQGPSGGCVGNEVRAYVSLIRA